MKTFATNKQHLIDHIYSAKSLNVLNLLVGFPNLAPAPFGE